MVWNCGKQRLGLLQSCRWQKAFELLAVYSKRNGEWENRKGQWVKPELVIAATCRHTCKCLTTLPPLSVTISNIPTASLCFCVSLTKQVCFCLHQNSSRKFKFQFHISLFSKPCRSPHSLFFLSTFALFIFTTSFLCSPQGLCFCNWSSFLSPYCFTCNQHFHSGGIEITARLWRSAE